MNVLGGGSIVLTQDV